MDHVQRAAELFTSGSNCAQAVFVAFTDVTGLDEDTAMRLASSFGGGMGRMREVCGACSAMFMVAGMVKGYTGTDGDEVKKEHYARIQCMAEQFKEKNCSIICRELLKGLSAGTLPTPTPRTEEFYKARPCLRFVTDAAQILDTLLNCDALHSSEG